MTPEETVEWLNDGVPILRGCHHEDIYTYMEMGYQHIGDGKIQVIFIIKKMNPTAPASKDKVLCRSESSIKAFAHWDKHYT